MRHRSWKDRADEDDSLGVCSVVGMGSDWKSETFGNGIVGSASSTNGTCGSGLVWTCCNSSGERGLRTSSTKTLLIVLFRRHSRFLKSVSAMALATMSSLS